MMDFQVSEKCVVPEEWKAGIGHDFRHYKGKGIARRGKLWYNFPR